MQAFNQIKISEVQLIWIPSHVNIFGNERADSLAKQSLSLPVVNSTNYLEVEEVFSIIKSHVIDEWQIKYENDPRGHHYKCICPSVDTSIKFLDLNRRKEVQLSRLRLGKVNLNERLFLMKKHKDGLCDTCRVTESIDHLLLSCKKELISNILSDKCALYNVDFNLKSLLGIGCIQSEVYRLVSLINKEKVV
jgi:DNA-binding MltR family transcriptional regulator